MVQSAICARVNRMLDSVEPSFVHLDCTGSVRYLNPETSDYVESDCGCSCHTEKREWFLSDFGPPPHKTLWIGQHRAFSHD